MTAPKRRRKITRWLMRGALLLALMAGSIGVALAVAMGTPWGRSQLLAFAIVRANVLLPGTIQIAALDRLSPWGISVSSIRLADPADVRVVELANIRVELAPLELLQGRVVLESIEIGPGHVDLHELGVAGRGLLGALIDPQAPPTPPSTGPPPYVRIDDLRVRGLSVTLPELSPWGTLDVRELQLSARVEVDGDPIVKLEALSFRVFRGERLQAELGPVTALLERPGSSSHVALEARALGASLRLAARGVLPPGSEDSPLRAELQIEGLSAEDLATLLVDQSLEHAFSVPLRLDVALSGSLNELLIESVLDTVGGQVQLQLGVKQQARVELAISADSLTLGKVREDLPQEPLSFRLTSSGNMANRAEIPGHVSVRSLALGRFALPDLDARGTWRGDGISDLRAEARRGQSSLHVTGDVGFAGELALATRIDVREPELVTLADAAGMGHRPKGTFGAALHLARTRGGDVRIDGDANVQKLAVAGVRLARADVSLDVAGTPPTLAGRVHAKLERAAFGETKLRAAEIQLEGGPERYRLRMSGDLDELRAHADLWLERRGGGVRAQGNAAGDFRGTAFAIDLAPTTISGAGTVESRGVELAVSGQTLHASGHFGGAGSALVVTGRELDLEQLSRLLGVLPVISGRAELEARLEGTLEEPNVRLELSGSQLRRASSAPLDATLDARLDAATGNLGVDAHVRPTTATGTGLDMTLSLTTTFEGGPGWVDRLESSQVELQLASKRLDMVELEPWVGRPLPVRGELALEVGLAGSIAEPVLRGRLRGKVRPLAIERSFEIDHAVDYASGSLETRLRVDDEHGRWLELDANLGVTPDAARHPDGIATLASTARWNVHLDVAERRLNQLSGDIGELPGNLQLEGSLDVSHESGSEPAGRASFRLGRAASSAPIAGCNDAGVELELDAELGSGRLKAVIVGTHRKAELLRGVSTVDVLLAPVLRGQPLVFGAIASHVESHQLDLQSLPFLCQRLRGKLDAVLDIIDPLGENPALDATIAATGFTLGAEPTLDITVRAHADRDDVSVDAGIAGKMGRSTLRAALPIEWSRGRFAVAPDARVSAHAALRNLPIAPLLDPGGAVSHASGRVSGEVHVEGPFAELEPSGQLELENGELTATALAQPLHGVRGRFEFDDKHLKIKHFEARDKDGLLEINGRVEIEDRAAIETALNVLVKDFPLRQQGQVVATMSAHAKIEAHVSSTRTDVSVVLRDADTWLEKTQARAGISLDPHSDVVLAGSANEPRPGHTSTSGLKPPAEAAARTTRLSLDATDHFWVKREDFAIQLSTRLVAHIDETKTSVKGRVEIHRGYLDLMGRVFDISRGSHLEFTGSGVADPIVNIEASHERRSSGKTVKVKISGRGSRPELSFFIDDGEVLVGKALEELVGPQRSGGEESARNDAASFVSGVTAGLLATSARRELGAAAPIIMIEPGSQTGDGRIRAGFELDSLVPDALASLITGVYLEGIVTKEGSNAQQNSTQAGVLVELYFPHQLFSTGQWGPGATWSLDWGWQL